MAIVTTAPGELASNLVAFEPDIAAIVVDLDASSDAAIDSPAALYPVVSAFPVPVVGIGGARLDSAARDIFDLWVEDAALLARLLRAIARNPAASATLVQVLRASGGLSSHDALAVESLAYGVLQGGAEFARWLAETRGRYTNNRPSSGKSPVRSIREDDVLQIVLDAPENRNALSVAMRDGLVDAFMLAAADTAIRSVRVSATGPCFCAGGDLSEFGSQKDSALSHFIRMHRMPARFLVQCADRCTVRVHGACIGAGIELPAFAASIEAAPGTIFRLPEVAMGLIPGAGGCVSIPRRIGRQRTALMAILGEDVPAETALEWGLIDEIVP